MCIRDRHHVLAADVGQEVALADQGATLVDAVHREAGFDPQLDRATHFLDADIRRDIACLLYTSDAADERSSVDLGGRRIIKTKKNMYR